jgi:hypothetical protein
VATKGTRSGTGEAWDLPADATVRLPRRRSGTVVCAVRGTVVVTQAEDPEDHVLEAGDEITLRGRGLAVAWALTEAAISVRRVTPRQGPAGAPSSHLVP